MSTWKCDEAEARVRDVLDAAKVNGPQTIIDRDGIYAVVFTRQKTDLYKLFSKPGPLHEDDFPT